MPASSRLTLAAGLRYEYNSPAVDTQDRANLYNPATGALGKVGSAGIPRAGYQADRNNFAPRLGLAWTIGQTVLRTGYGVYYDQSPLAPGEVVGNYQPIEPTEEANAVVAAKLAGER